MTSHAQGLMPVSVAESFDQIKRGLLFKKELMTDSRGQAPDLTQPMWSAIELFDELGIGYALIGGLASMLYGTARHTLDVDFVAAVGYEAKMADHPRIMRRHGFDPSCTWKLYHDSGVDIDIWKDQHAEEIVSRAKATVFNDRTLRVADPHDLIAMKLRADRPQDDYDISEVLKHMPIDDATLKERVAADQFARFGAIRRRIGMG